ncbi:tetratricopeptide repeat protein [Amycolatopsis sp. CA-126428]|uniref:tetratricopeptide repeat protein n=1 Tax=Amycolatopsis sp. CA-126428 TaxID=2073158 RepID=UPI0011B0E626|nr:tetratricopeptide repeat protein [Amycolatopsis sp. CA-126428]
MSTRIDEAEAALCCFDGAAALSAFDEVLETDAHSDRALAGRVRALWMLRRWKDARARLAELDDRDHSVHVALARGLVALGQPDDPSYLAVDCGSAKRDDETAIAAFERAARLDESSVEAVAGLATAYRMAGRLPKAEEVLRNARPRLRSSAPALVESAMCRMEQDDLSAAEEYVSLAIADDPGYVQAQLVRLELRRRSDYGNAELVALAEGLVNRQPGPTAVALELYGWVLLDRADLTGDRQLRDKALEQFNRAEALGPVMPGVINGKIVIHLGNSQFEQAFKVVDAAIESEPTSPQLYLSRAEIMAAAGELPRARLDTYHRVLDLEPRDLSARLAKVRALISLHRIPEATEIVEVLREELPGNRRVDAAAMWLREPAQMPESRVLELKIDRPWENGKDDPDQLLDLLTNEVSVNLGLTRPVAGRLGELVVGDRKALLQRAFEEEQKYLQARARFRGQAQRARKGAPVRWLGHLLFESAFVFGTLALAVLIWLISGRGEPFTGWRLALTAAFPIVFFVIAFFDRKYKLPVDLAPTFAAFGGAAVLAASICLGVVRFGAGLGSVVGIGVAVAVIGAVIGGALLRNQFAKPSPLGPQQAFDQWLESLYGNGLLPLAIGARASHERVYGTCLPVLDGTYSDAPVEIDTPASGDLRRLLRQRSKGSFALAGPRGVGKSTLLDRWCAGQFLRDAESAQRVRHDLTIKVDAPVGYQSKEFLIHLFGKLCDEVEKYVRSLEGLRNRPGEPAPRRLLRLTGSERFDRVDRPEGNVQPADLAARAKEERENIRFVQSRTKEGELSLGLTPLKGTSVGYKAKGTVRRDDVPLNHPELVDRFRDFLGQTAQLVEELRCKVLIGIDELDRISDGEGAQRFLNELKAVFNVRNCYFLVSVSEDALAEFELAAMGMRTVFDSAFDQIVRVDYFSFEEARSLLNRRIRDLPEQFAALAYVFSGGLARELARTAEAIAGGCSSEEELGSVAGHLVQRQLDRTTRAAMDRVSRSPDRRAGAALIPVLDERPVGKLTGGMLREYAVKVADIGHAKAESVGLAGVRLDVVAMVEYLAVLLDVFDGRLVEDRMAAGLERGFGAFENLARVRRYLGANSSGARELLRGFCGAWELPGAAPAPKSRTCVLPPRRDGHARGAARLGLNHSNGAGR